MSVSDPLALLLALCMLLCCAQALVHKPWRWLYGAATLAGLMLGVRLSYVPLLTCLVVTTWHISTRQKQQHVSQKRLLWQQLIMVGLCFWLSCSLWLSWQVMMEPQGFVQAARAHLYGHFAVWGGGVSTSEGVTYLSRIITLGRVLSVFGLGGWWPGEALLRLLVGFAWLGLLGAAWLHLWRERWHVHSWLWLCGSWTLPYLLWWVVVHDVSLSRYSLPVVAILCVLAGVGGAALRRYGQALIAGTLIGLAAITLPLATALRDSPPIGRQLAAYLQQYPVVHGRVHGATQAGAYKSAEVLLISGGVPLFVRAYAPAVRTIIAQPGLSAAQLSRYQAAGFSVYATELALSQPEVAQLGWQPVARFCQHPHIESRGPHQLLLYRYQPAAESLTAPGIMGVSDVSSEGSSPMSAQPVSELPCHPVPSGLRD